MDEYVGRLTAVQNGRVRANSAVLSFDRNLRLLNKFFDACESDDEFCRFYFIEERMRFPSLFELIENVIDRDSSTMLEIVCKARKDDIYEIICTNIPEIYSCSMELRLKSESSDAFMTFAHNIEKMVRVSKALGIKCEVKHKDINVRDIINNVIYENMDFRRIEDLTQLNRYFAIGTEFRRD